MRVKEQSFQIMGKGISVNTTETLVIRFDADIPVAKSTVIEVHIQPLEDMVEMLSGSKLKSMINSVPQKDRLTLQTFPPNKIDAIENYYAKMASNPNLVGVGPLSDMNLKHFFPSDISLELDCLFLKQLKNTWSSTPHRGYDTWRAYCRKWEIHESLVEN